MGCQLRKLIEVALSTLTSDVQKVNEMQHMC